MAFCQIIIHQETAFDCFLELGYLGNVQLIDNSDGVRSSGKFNSEIQRCAEMERIMKRLQEEIRKSDMTPNYFPDVEKQEALRQNDLASIETTLLQLDTELTEVVRHCEALQNRRLNLIERREVLLKTQNFLTGSRNTEIQIAAQDSVIQDILHDTMGESEENAGGVGGRRRTERAGPLNFITGSIAVERFAAFEVMIWRVSRGNAYVKSSEYEIPEDIGKRFNMNCVRRAFIIIFVGNELQPKFTKICQGFHVKLYQCPATQGERKTELRRISKELEDLSEICEQSCEHKRRVLAVAVSDLCIWRSKVKRLMAVYYELNRLGPIDELRTTNQKYLQADCWIPKSDVGLVRSALKRGARRAAQGDPAIMFPPMLIERPLPHHAQPPTYFRTNKFTRGFQNLIDSYGMATYRELNPAPYTIITFPFLFAIMFGDMGHGMLMALFAFALIRTEEKILRNQKEAAKKNEVFDILFAGRYIIFLMGLFSMYAGLIYNDVMALSMNIFGSSWRVNEEYTDFKELVELDPANKEDYRGIPYPIGIDPVWTPLSKNEIIHSNSIKMKMSIILGVAQMLFGLILSGWNAAFFGSKIDLFLVFIPQVLFMTCLFFYLVVLMFYKWTWFGGHSTGEYSAACAPSILITFINMVLFKGAEEPPEGCNSSMYSGQRITQLVLLMLALLCIPVLLCGKPFHFMYQHRRIKSIQDTNQQDILRRNTQQSLRKSLIYNLSFSESVPSLKDEADEDEKLSDIWIHQGIHTIETVLGSVSHTASYLRLWALSLAHKQLSEVLFEMILSKGFHSPGFLGVAVLVPAFLIFAVLTVAILVVMEGLSAFLHTLRLHWVEFQSKFYGGLGEAFVPFHFQPLVKSDLVS